MDDRNLEDMIEEIKDAAVQLGVDVVSDIVGYEIDEDYDDIDSLMSEALDQMPGEDIVNLYCRYCQ